MAENNYIGNVYQIFLNFCMWLEVFFKFFFLSYLSYFFAYGYASIGVTNQCSFLSRLCQGKPKVNAIMLKFFNIIFQRLEVKLFFCIWVCIHTSDKLIQFHQVSVFYYTKACLLYFKMIFQSALINSVLAFWYFLPFEGMPAVVQDNISKCFNV